MVRSDPIRLLLAIFTVIWVLVLAGAIIIFQFIVPLSIFHDFVNGIVQGVLASILVVVWLGVFILMRNQMVKRQLRKATQ